MEYFIINNGIQEGPYPLSELPKHGLNPESYVWREGLTGWMQAYQLPELAEILRNPYQADDSLPFGNQGYENQQPGHNYGWNNQPKPNYPPLPNTAHTDWLPWAIVATVLNCCSCIGLVFSIIGIVQASKANNLYRNGYISQAETANSNAKLMTIISLAIAGLGIASSIFLYMTSAFPEFINLANYRNVIG